MVKHTQAIRRLLPMNYLSVFDHFVGLALKGLKQAFSLKGYCLFRFFFLFFTFLLFHFLARLFFG